MVILKSVSFLSKKILIEPETPSLSQTRPLPWSLSKKARNRFWLNKYRGSLSLPAWPACRERTIEGKNRLWRLLVVLFSVRMEGVQRLQGKAWRSGTECRLQTSYPFYPKLSDIERYKANQLVTTGTYLLLRQICTLRPSSLLCWATANTFLDVFCWEKYQWYWSSGHVTLAAYTSPEIWWSGFI